MLQPRHSLLSYYMSCVLPMHFLHCQSPKHALKLWLGLKLGIRGVFRHWRGPNALSIHNCTSASACLHLHCISRTISTPSTTISSRRYLLKAWRLFQTLRTRGLPFSITFPPLSDVPILLPPTLSLHTDDIKCCDLHPHEYHSHRVISGLHLRNSTGAPLLKSSTSTLAVPARKRPAFCCWTSASSSSFALVPGVCVSLCPRRILRHPIQLLLEALVGI